MPWYVVSTLVYSPILSCDKMPIIMHHMDIQTKFHSLGLTLHYARVQILQVHKHKISPFMCQDRLAMALASID